MHKVARLCWNSLNWVCPTGPEGKSRNRNSYEHGNDYGLEEWLFDIDKLIDGYHYGYVQGVANSRRKHAGKSMDLSLYTIHGHTRQRLWIGTVRNVQVVGPEESSRVYEQYRKRGWLAKMRAGLPGEASRDAFDNVTADIFAVLKFTIPDMCLLDRPIEFTHLDRAVASDYYNLKDYICEPGSIAAAGIARFTPGHNPQTRKGAVEYEAQTREFRDLHADVQDELYRQLRDEYGAENVETEHHTGAGSRVDAAVRHDDKLALYEIKAGLTLRSCVREAVGQLLEYRHVIGAPTVSEMVIVTPHRPTAEIDEYLDDLRRRHRLPFRYRQCCPPSAVPDDPAG